MAATVTLSTTTLLATVSKTDTTVSLASTTGVTPGIRLYVDQELMGVLSLGLGTSVNVLRGLEGTATTAHLSGATVTIGRGDQFYLQDPTGVPPTPVLVSPWINVITGTYWTAQGDETGPNQAQWWQPTVTTRSIGPLGVRTVTTAP